MKVDHKTGLHDSGNVRVIHPREIIMFPIFVSLWNNSPMVGWGLFIKASRSYSDTPHLLGLLWTSDQSVPETYIWPHTTLTRDTIPPAGFELAVPVRERPQAHDLDCGHENRRFVSNAEENSWLPQIWRLQRNRKSSDVIADNEGQELI